MPLVIRATRVASAAADGRTVRHEVRRGSRGTTAPGVSAAVALAAVGVATAFLPFLAQFVHGAIERRVNADARDKLFAAVDRLVGLQQFEDPAFLDRLEVAKQAASSPSDAVNTAAEIVRALLTSLTLIASLLLVNPTMAVVLVLSAVPVAVVEFRLSRRRGSHCPCVSQGGCRPGHSR